MSENVTETATEVDLSQHEDTSISRLWSKLKLHESQLLETHNKIKNSAPPSDAELKTRIEESDDEKIVKLRVQIEKAQETIRKAEEAARAHILSQIETLSEDDIKELRKTASEQGDKVRSLVTLIKTNADVLDYDDVVKLMSDYKVPTLRGVSTGSSTSRSSSNGTTRSTPRITSIQIVKDGKELMHFTGDKGRLAYGARYIKAETEAVMNAWLDAAGVTDWHDIKEEVSFEIQSNDTTYEVTVYPKS